MGDAKRRGSFEQRKEQAIESDHQIKLRQIKTPQPAVRLRGTSRINPLILVLVLTGCAVQPSTYQGPPIPERQIVISWP